jgi:hypothetical protein
VPVANLFLGEPGMQRRDGQRVVGDRDPKEGFYVLQQVVYGTLEFISNVPYYGIFIINPYEMRFRHYY